MKCPNDNATLQMTDRSGIEIDYCPDCRGVWLDRGELDKLIERSASQEASLHRQEPPRRYDDDDDDRYRHDSHDKYYRDHHKKHRKDSLLGEIFSF